MLFGVKSWPECTSVLFGVKCWLESTVVLFGVKCLPSVRPCGRVGRSVRWTRCGCPQCSACSLHGPATTAGHAASHGTPGGRGQRARVKE